MHLSKLLDTELLAKHLEDGYVDECFHDTFPLRMLTYGRRAVQENLWDDVTTRCRGLIVHRDTGEVVARPFFKFFNLGTANMPETNPENWTAFPDPGGDPEVWEKMDGFLATAYQYNGEWFVASKGSFHSTHAKWATAWYRAHVGVAEGEAQWPEGYTPVFEGICSSLRIVVNYEFEGLVLLALVKNETGEEMNQTSLRVWANANGVRTPTLFLRTWQEARALSLDTDAKNFEGYVLTWRRPGQTPFRLKVKYVDYLRLHRMVSGVSAKAIYNCLAGNEYKGDLDEWCNESTPWFSKFVTKWVRALQAEHDRISGRAQSLYDKALAAVNRNENRNMGAIRKDFAEFFNRPEHKDVAGVLFAMLDGKDVERVIWKQVKPMIKASKPMLDLSKM